MRNSKANTDKKKSKPYELLSKRPDVYDLKDALKVFGSRRKIAHLLDEDKLHKISHGLYSSVADPIAEVLMVMSKYYPEAVVSGPSALYFHELGELMQDKIEINISRENSMRENPLFEVKRVAPKYLTGIINKIRGTHSFRIYSRERSLFEAEKFSPSMLSFAIKIYVKGNIDFDELERLDAIFGGDVLKLVRHETNNSSV